MDRARPTPFSFSSQGQSVQLPPAVFQISLIPAEVTVALGLVGFRHACNFRSGNACLAVFSLNDTHQQTRSGLLPFSHQIFVIFSLEAGPNNWPKLLWYHLRALVKAILLVLHSCNLTNGYLDWTDIHLLSPFRGALSEGKTRIEYDRLSTVWGLPLLSRGPLRFFPPTQSDP